MSVSRTIARRAARIEHQEDLLIAQGIEPKTANTSRRIALAGAGSSGIRRRTAKLVAEHNAKARAAGVLTSRQRVKRDELRMLAQTDSLTAAEFEHLSKLEGRKALCVGDQAKQADVYMAKQTAKLRAARGAV